jgi:hypothetical protein
LSVDGSDNSEDYIGGFLQNFSPDATQEFAVRTAGEDADTGRTTAASIVITTKRGTNDWHGEGAFYNRQASLNSRFPIENPAPNPKQPFSRQNYVGAVGGPIVRDKVWFFSSLEYVRENASIAYSPASQAQFNALAQLAQQGLIDANGAMVNSIPTPNIVPVPFRAYLATTRFDWAQSVRSQWFLRAAIAAPSSTASRLVSTSSAAHPTCKPTCASAALSPSTSVGRLFPSSSQHRRRYNLNYAEKMVSGRTDSFASGWFDGMIFPGL